MLPNGKEVRRRRKLKTHCKRGHEYAAVGVWLNKDGYRVCKECHRARCRAHVKANLPKYAEANHRWRNRQQEAS